jgi:sulfur relay (sulfurtransferase) complex TusBCD TusD component (DsrE family)
MTEDYYMESKRRNFISFHQVKILEMIMKKLGIELEVCESCYGSGFVTSRGEKTVCKDCYGCGFNFSGLEKV